LSNSDFNIRRRHSENIGGEPSIIEVKYFAFKSARTDTYMRRPSKKGEKDMQRFSRVQVGQNQARICRVAPGGDSRDS